MSTQCERVEAYLSERGSITPLDAWQYLGVYRLAARINDLRKRGVNIITESCQVENQFHEKCTVARYRLTQPQMELI